MSCVEFRRAVGAQPDLETAALRAHEATCAACARYRQELRQMDRLIHRALSIDSPSMAATADRSAATSAPAQRRSVSRSRTGYWAAAASFLAAVGLGSFLWIANPSPSFAEQLVHHVQHEADALVSTPDRVEAAALAEILARSGLRLKPGAMNVSYVMSCWFRGDYAPHMVVQTADGPVTVLVLRHETSLPGPQTFEEEGFSGVIVPAPRGVLAVLGRGAPVEAAARDVLNALEYDE